MVDHTCQNLRTCKSANILSTYYVGASFKEMSVARAGLLRLTSSWRQEMHRLHLNIAYQTTSVASSY